LLRLSEAIATPLTLMPRIHGLSDQLSRIGDHYVAQSEKKTDLPIPSTEMLEIEVLRKSAAVKHEDSGKYTMRFNRGNAKRGSIVLRSHQGTLQENRKKRMVISPVFRISWLSIICIMPI